MGLHYADGGANLGFQHNFKNTPSGWSHQGARMMVQYKNAAGNEVGTDAQYDKVNKKMDIALATRLNFDDHSLGMKVNNTGVAQLLFGWKQNASCTGTVGTTVNLSEFGKGRLSGFPLSW